eukprot:scaffold175903_cov25-Tisochrysis_lutea.AAC.2
MQCLVVHVQHLAVHMQYLAIQRMYWVGLCFALQSPARGGVAEVVAQEQQQQRLPSIAFPEHGAA